MPYNRRCVECGDTFTSIRSDALVCGKRCRKQRNRAARRVRDHESGRAEVRAMLAKVPDHAIARIRSTVANVLEAERQRQEDRIRRWPGLAGE